MTCKAEIIPDNLLRIMPAKGEKAQAPPNLSANRRKEYRRGLLLSWIFSSIFNDEEIICMRIFMHRFFYGTGTKRKEI
jgi:hypothetical protein